MRAMSKILIALLTVAILAAYISPVSAASNHSRSTGSQQDNLLTDLYKLKAPFGNNYLNYNKLVNELAKTDKKVTGYFERNGVHAFGTGSASKTLTRNVDGTWHVTIYLTVPTGLTANVYDYLTNLEPIPGSFTPIQPDIVNDGYVEYDGLPAGSYVLQYNARQILPGFVADQVFVREYAFGAPGGFLFSTRSVGWWFDIVP